MLVINASVEFKIACTNYSITQTILTNKYQRPEKARNEPYGHVTILVLTKEYG